MGISSRRMLTQEEKDLQLRHIRHADIHRKCMEIMLLDRNTCPLCDAPTNLIIDPSRFEMYISHVLGNVWELNQWSYVDMSLKAVGRCLSRLILIAFRRYKKDVIGIEMLVQNPISVLLSPIVWLEVENRIIPGFHSPEYAIISSCIYFLFRRLKNVLVYDMYGDFYGVDERCVKFTTIFFRCLMLFINIMFLDFRFTEIGQFITGEYDSDNIRIAPILHIPYFTVVTSVTLFFAANLPKKHEMIARDCWEGWERVTYLGFIICNFFMLNNTKENDMQWILGISSFLAGLLDTQSQWFMFFTTSFAFETDCLGEYGAGINYGDKFTVNYCKVMMYLWIMQFFAHLMWMTVRQHMCK